MGSPYYIVNKSLLILSFFIGSFVSAKSQTSSISNAKYLDDCDALILYDCTFLDTIVNQVQSYEMVLQVGDKFQKFFDANQFLIDTIIWHNSTSLNEQQIAQLYFSNTPRTFEKLWRNTTNETFTLYGNWYSLRYSVEDSTATQIWNVSYSDTIIVCGYPCMKATATFRGRNWTAWFTKKLNIDSGPWKLHGLPGCILKAEDATSMIQFEAIHVSTKEDFPIEMDGEHKRRRKISRNKYIEYERMAALQPNEFYEMTHPLRPADSENIIMPRQFYCPLEWE